MSRRYLLPLLVLFVLLAPSLSQVCSLSSNANDLLQSGLTTITNAYSNNINRREHRFTFTVGFTVPASGLQVAACTFISTQRPQPLQQ